MFLKQNISLIDSSILKTLMKSKMFFVEYVLNNTFNKFSPIIILEGRFLEQRYIKKESLVYVYTTINQIDIIINKCITCLE